MLPETLRGVCFDIGGVLVDVGGTGFLAEELADLLHAPAPQVRDLLIRHGKTQPRSPENLATAVTAGCAQPGAYEPVLEALIRRHAAMEEAVLFPEVLPVLRAVRGRGWRIAFLSNAIGHHGLCRPAYYDQADVVVHSWEIGVCKPDPRAFRAVESRLALAPHELVAVGDSLRADIRGALQAGWSAVHVPRTGGAVSDEGVPVCADLSEVLSLLPDRSREAER